MNFIWIILCRYIILKKLKFSQKLPIFIDNYSKIQFKLKKHHLEATQGCSSYQLRFPDSIICYFISILIQLLHKKNNDFYEQKKITTDNTCLFIGSMVWGSRTHQPQHLPDIVSWRLRRKHFAATRPAANKFGTIRNLPRDPTIHKPIDKTDYYSIIKRSNNSTDSSAQRFFVSRVAYPPTTTPLPDIVSWRLRRKHFAATRPAANKFGAIRNLPRDQRIKEPGD